MNILHINTEDSIGGASIACSRLHKSLLSQGIESSLLVLNQRDKTIPRSFNVREVYLSSIWKRASLFLRQKKVQKKIAQLKSGSPDFSDPISFPISPFDITAHSLYKKADIIHFHWTANYLDFPSFFKNNKKPVVWTIHDKGPITGGPHCITGFEEENYQKILQHNKKIIRAALTNQQIHYVSPSEEYHKLALQSELLHAFHHHKIFHGLDTAIFKPINKQLAKEFWNLPQNKPILLFVATSKNRPLKGMSILEEALKKLSQDHFLCIIGEGFEGMNNENTKSLGIIKDERLMALAYSAADVFISPSLEESYGLALVEAISCGTPSISFPVGAAPELIQNDVNGRIATDFSPTALLNAIQRMLGQNFDQLSVSKSIQETIDEKNCTLQYVNLYKQLLTND